MAELTWSRPSSPLTPSTGVTGIAIRFSDRNERIAFDALRSRSRPAVHRASRFAGGEAESLANPSRHRESAYAFRRHSRPGRTGRCAHGAQGDHPLGSASALRGARQGLDRGRQACRLHAVGRSAHRSGGRPDGALRARDDQAWRVGLSSGAVTWHLYQRDLAAIQAEAYGGHVEQSAPGLIARLRAALPQGARVVDLGRRGDWLAHSARPASKQWATTPRRICAIARVLPTRRCLRARGRRVPRGCAGGDGLGEIFNYLPPTGRLRSSPRPAAFIGRCRGGSSSSTSSSVARLAGASGLDGRSGLAHGSELERRVHARSAGSRCSRGRAIDGAGPMRCTPAGARPRRFRCAAAGGFQGAGTHALARGGVAAAAAGVWRERSASRSRLRTGGLPR